MTTTSVAEAQVLAVRGGFVVASRTTEGAHWLVTVDRRDIRCSCPAGRHNVAEGNGRACWHARAAVAWQLAEDRKNARPSYPVNYAAFE